MPSRKREGRARMVPVARSKMLGDGGMDGREGEELVLVSLGQKVLDAFARRLELHVGEHDRELTVTLGRHGTHAIEEQDARPKRHVLRNLCHA
jgi:hypothetical protein